MTEYVAVAEWVHQENKSNGYIHYIILIRKGWNKLGITHNCPPFNNLKKVFFYLKHSCSIYMKTMYSIFISNYTLWRRWFWKARVTITIALLHFSTVFRTKLKNSLIHQEIFIEKLLHSRYQRDPGETEMKKPYAITMLVDRHISRENRQWTKSCKEKKLLH